jgi:hypothetical protein
MRRLLEGQGKVVALAVGFLAAGPVHAAGLSAITSQLNGWTTDLRLWIGIVSVIGFMVLGVAFAAKWIRFPTLLQWCAGLLIAGCAGELGASFFH